MRLAGFVAVACAPAALILAGDTARGQELDGALLYAAAVTPLLLASARWPTFAFAGVLLVAAFAGPSATLAAMVAAYSVGLRCSRRVAFAAVLVATALLTAVSELHGLRYLSEWALSHFALVGIAAGAGVWQRARIAYVERLRDHATRLEREQELLSDRAIAEERVRIARELHDAVGHSVSLMVVQAQARAVSSEEPEAGRAALLALADTGRRAMGELHRMLDVLRMGEDEDERLPQPGIDDLGRLLDDARAAGIDARLEIQGERRPLAATLELSAYRIVQEALTNVVRHVGAGRTEVNVRFGLDRLQLRITDDGEVSEPAAAGIAAAGGHGLAGMRERVAIFNGSIEAGPRADGPGFVVRAVLPLDVSA
jgi:signal transduction histidine kinase